MPNINETSMNRNILNETEINTNVAVLTPVLLEASATSSRSIAVLWKDPRPSSEKSAGYYMVCFVEVKSQHNCEDGPNIVKR